MTLLIYSRVSPRSKVEIHMRTGIAKLEDQTSKDNTEGRDHESAPRLTRISLFPSSRRYTRLISSGDAVDGAYKVHETLHKKVLKIEAERWRENSTAMSSARGQTLRLHNL